MTYFNFRLKPILLVTSISLFTVATAAESHSKSSELQQRDSAELMSRSAGTLSQARSANHKRLAVITAQSEQDNTKSGKDKKYRPSDRTTKSASSDFFFADAFAELLFDEDYDGYFSEFRVNFDADTSFTYADVYAELYFSINGGPWELYHETNVFRINGFSDYDDYSVTTYLTEGYPPGSYDILIDLIDTYNGQLVATVSADQLYSLADLPLEDATFEDSVYYDSDVSIFDAHIQLLNDYDNDGFYRTYSLTFDADVNYGTAQVFAKIWMRDSSGDWYLETTTEDILLNGNSTQDTYILETTLASGYSTGYYDFKIDIYDSQTLSLLTTSDAFDGQLASVPLEDAGADSVPSSTTVVTSTVVVESGGAGSLSALMALLLMTMVWRRQRQA